MTMSSLPEEARSWLREVERRLGPLPEDPRAETLQGLAEHLGELAADGIGGPEAVARLGSAREVAEAAFQQHREQTGEDTRVRYLTTKRALQLAALALAVAGAAAVALLPSYIRVSTSSDGTEHVDAATVLEVVGVWYLAVLAIPVIAAVLPLPAIGRAWQPLSIVSAVLLAAFSFVGSLSIGWYFLPAAIVAIVAACFPTRPRIR